MATSHVDEQEILVLKKAFDLFNANTEQLQNAYQKLQEQVRQINQELEETNVQLSEKVSELDHARQYLHSVHESMSDGLVAMDLRGNLTVFNRAAEQITGFCEQDIQGQDVQKIEALEPVFRSMSKSLHSKQAFSHQQKLIMRKDGQSLWIESSTAPIVDKLGQVIGVVESFKDLSDVQALEKKLRRKDRLAALGQMAATVAHEIRNPLGGIEGFAALLKRDFQDDPHKSKMVQNIIDGTRNLNKIVTNLLVYTRPLKLNIQAMDLVACLNGALFYVKEQSKVMPKQDVFYDCQFARESCWIYGDVESLKQVFLNVLINALDAIGDQGTITVKLEQDDAQSMAKVSICDDGPGIPEPVREKIFDPFFTTKEHGTGLGLAIAYKQLEEQNGRIFIESQESGQTCFAVQLPLKT